MKVKFANRIYEVLFTKELAGLTMYAVEDEPNHIDWLINVEVVDAEKKELRKIEQKHVKVPKFKVGDFIQFKGMGHTRYTIKEVCGLSHYINSCNKRMDMSYTDANFELVEQKPAAWSEEDERMYTAIIFALAGFMGNEDKLDWFKSLKDRVQLKQEWKQENTDDLTDFENAMMHIGGSFFGQHAGLDPNDTNAIKEQANLLLELVSSKEWSEEDAEMINYVASILYSNFNENEKFDNNKPCVGALVDWLKSLKERYTWKPSDLPHWKKSNLPNDNTTGFNSDYFCYKGYSINYKELFEKLLKDD